MKDVDRRRDIDDDRDNGTNGEERKGIPIDGTTDQLELTHISGHGIPDTSP